ncbi:hypothetical protein BGY98DRAFT_136600 [Russula aff. rugulosa BPL654]|nr:hypothetical protein BGY98DRAFT_136600 [Russula aff. rugulosa BPL654]
MRKAAVQTLCAQKWRRANGFGDLTRALRALKFTFIIIDHGLRIHIFHVCFYHFLFATGQQLLETALASIRFIILILRRGFLVLFFGRVDILAGMAKARFVITLISLHQNKRASLLPCLEESWKGDIDIR